MKAKTMILLTAAVAAAAAFAAPRNSRKGAAAAADDGSASNPLSTKITIDQAPRTGQSSCLGMNGIEGASMIGRCYTKPRSWIVIETKYTTYAKFLDQLTFNWHVVLDTKTAKENKGNKMGLAPYSYFNTSVTYYNIPKGSHAACVCLPPSYLELYGEPKAIGFEITNQNGDILGGDAVSEIKAIKPHTKFWEMDNFKDAMGGEKPSIERRQGLVDRSKTIWALVNPNDYETTMQ